MPAKTERCNGGFDNRLIGLFSGFLSHLGRQQFLAHVLILWVNSKFACSVAGRMLRRSRLVCRSISGRSSAVQSAVVPGPGARRGGGWTKPINVRSLKQLGLTSRRADDEPMRTTAAIVVAARRPKHPWPNTTTATGGPGDQRDATFFVMRGVWYLKHLHARGDDEPFMSGRDRFKRCSHSFRGETIRA